MNDKLIQIQAELKAPKAQRNSFGNYNYRSCEDILEALKPLLQQHSLAIIIGDEVVNIGSFNYIKATVTLSDGENYLTTTAYAREAETKKGMDDSQITGAASSYARKYALNGMFAIDDTKDADAHDNRTTTPKAANPRLEVPKAPNPMLKPKTDGYLAGAKNELNEMFETYGYDNTVKKKAFISKVLTKSTIDTLDEADKVMLELTNEN